MMLYSFTGGLDGNLPYGGMVRDPAGNFYGTTAYGGAWSKGVVFKLDTMGSETVLYHFTGGLDGGIPYAGLIRDSAGTLFGTTIAAADAPSQVPAGPVGEGHETGVQQHAGGESDGCVLPSMPNPAGKPVRRTWWDSDCR
jgi:uncharacterized repeat protein (TIGR03803 family)